MDRNTTAAARASGPDIDDECPAWAMDRIAALERLARSLYRSLSSQPQPQARALDLESARLACDLLDLEPPGFDPSTEGP